MKFSSVLSSFVIVGFVYWSSACTQEQSELNVPEEVASNFQIGSNSSANSDLIMPAPTTGWLTNGGTTFNQRWSPLTQINRDNVSQLKAVWRVHLNGSGMDTKHSGEGQPLVSDGIVYSVTGDDDVFAISVSTGEMLWSREADLPEGLGRSICCGWISRGLGMGEGKLFSGQLDGKLLALDIDTGDVIWQVQAEQWEQGYSITGAPLYYDGMVITGFAGAEYGVRGLVKAYSADTGEHLWTFYTVPGPGEPGHETWPQDNDVWQHGGGTVWQTPAIDPEANLLYFSTGNPGPDFDGGVRPGDNLFTASIVAIDVNTGEYRWHFQQVHHDIWDYDSPNPVILFDYVLDGVERKGLAQASKTGWVYILDRLTGEPLIGIDEREVPQLAAQATAATQPYPRGDSFVPQYIDMAPENVTLVNQGRIFTPFGPGQPVMFQPSPAGSANWAPSSYDPNRQVMYICAAETAMTLGGGELGTEIPDELNGDLFTGGGFGGVARAQNGVIAAVDMKTNELVWQYRWPDTCYSGFVSTAGDILFVGRNDGRLMALDSDTGHALWEFQTGAGMNSTVSIFEQEGQQYIVAYSAGNVFAGSFHGDSMWLFSLDGTMDETTEGDTILSDAGSAALPANEIEVVFADGMPDVIAGAQLYRQTCLPCHGEDGMSGHGGGAPLNTLTDINQAITVVSRGRNDMPTFAGALSPEQIRDVSGYLLDELFE